MIDLSIGWQFDLAIVVCVLALTGACLLWRWYERRHRRQINRQDLAGPERVVRVPIHTHEGDWDWPRRLEAHRLRDS